MIRASIIIWKRNIFSLYVFDSIYNTVMLTIFYERVGVLTNFISLLFGIHG